MNADHERGESADLRGHAIDTFPPDQNVDIALELVEEGVDEADIDPRRAAKDADRSKLDWSTARQCAVS